MTTLNVYLAFNGNCEEAFDFYKSVLGGEFSHVARFGEMPLSDNCPPVAEKDKNLIMHVSLPISKETVLMGSDSIEAFGPLPTQGNNFSLSLNTDSKEEADRIFAGLSAGGKVIMPMDKTFWGSYFGMFTDKFGIQWMVSFELEPH
ncbi:VOC family protein [Marinifilum fragile]|uniref:VOC family protein n=1 Tax=Marinifilum fragile TaxID=570161 RepID=UPI002AA61DA2|nr:VOC family protein [Marinifilum fragile]